MEEMVVRWTARLAVAGYLARVSCDIQDPAAASTQKWARRWWTFGCGIFLIHVVCAFHFEYQWDHAKAFEYTARRTREVTGWNSGVGLCINELFLCLWIADTAAWWRNLYWPVACRRVYWGVQSLFAFLMIQATVVFGPPFWKPVGVFVIGTLVWQWLRRRRRIVTSFEAKAL